jgi:hypothetical protein
MRVNNARPTGMRSRGRRCRRSPHDEFGGELDVARVELLAGTSRIAVQSATLPISRKGYRTVNRRFGIDDR